MTEPVQSCSADISDPVGYFAFVPAPPGEGETLRIRAWTTDAERAKSIGEVIGREMEPLYRRVAQSVDGHCQKCGCDLNGEAALVVWCHPCADAAQPPAAPVSDTAAYPDLNDAAHAPPGPHERSSAGSALRPDVREALEQALDRLHGIEDYRLGKKAAIPSVQGAIELICSALSSPHPADVPQTLSNQEGSN